MGYAIGHGPCYMCGRIIGFNPTNVPSYKGEPICADCIEAVNAEREKLGRQPFTIPPDAYSPVDERELNY